MLLTERFKRGMKIIKTSEQVKQEKEARARAYLEMNMCPECFNITSPSDISTVIKRTTYEGYSRVVFTATCRKCGCVWESEEF